MNSISFKVLVVAVHFEVTGARYITDAFKRLGHDVRHIGSPARLKDAWGVDVPEKYIWTPDDYPVDWNPDLVIIADTLTPLQNVSGRALENTPVIKYIQDNHVRNVRENGIAHYFLAHKHGQAQPVTHEDETWLPCAADLTAFTPSPIAWDDREYDVCTIGVLYPRRAKLVEMLREAGLKVFAATGLVYDEYRDAYHNSRISLCVSVAGDVAQRVFETAAMGCLVLTDLLTDLLDPAANQALGLSGFVVYQSDEECVQLALELINDQPKLAQAGALTMQTIVRQFHSWEQRAQVVVDWYKRNNGVKQVSEVNQHADAMELNDGRETLQALEERRDTFYIDNQPAVAVKTGQKAYLNLGCGKTHLPSLPPPGHEVVEASIYEYKHWLNVDKVEGVGADKVFDLFTYPWSLEDNGYDGALLAHIVEHIPHEIKLVDDSLRAKELSCLQDGWYAFFAELYRVLKPGAIVHIVSPYGWSDGAITDPTHIRYLTINTFTHSMSPEVSDSATFQYNNGGINFVIDWQPIYRFTPYAELLQQHTGFGLETLLGTNLNVCYDFYVRLKAVKLPHN